jgi:hypothetical protein
MLKNTTSGQPPNTQSQQRHVTFATEVEFTEPFIAQPDPDTGLVEFGDLNDTDLEEQSSSPLNSRLAMPWPILRRDAEYGCLTHDYFTVFANNSIDFAIEKVIVTSNSRDPETLDFYIYFRARNLIDPEVLHEYDKLRESISAAVYLGQQKSWSEDGRPMPNPTKFRVPNFETGLSLRKFAINLFLKPKSYQYFWIEHAKTIQISKAEVEEQPFKRRMAFMYEIMREKWICSAETQDDPPKTIGGSLDNTFQRVYVR